MHIRDDDSDEIHTNKNEVSATKLCITVYPFETSGRRKGIAANEQTRRVSKNFHYKHATIQTSETDDSDSSLPHTQTRGVEKYL